MPCDLFDRDLSVIVHDYGPNGHIGPVAIQVPKGLKPGGTISTVITTDIDIAINIKDAAQNILLHVVSRVTKDDFGLNTHMNGQWGKEEKVSKIPVKKGVRCVTTIVYEEEGYRIFINGATVAFYKHRTENLPHLVEITNGQVYKIIYQNSKEILP